mmetsp:Transcript_41463/g.29893  ORF Transcript_41463/g.29893 Transcript_41463/m.29893 type:complete len:170 (-) Transcript_41463:405-914(-)|eukprot:CAMPEP_0116882698 /NCGR_PEP_ID=MMETSP0463-20121206/15043_1 /TAXON_ID=181622 /ORGANISM="Strombidinopsis sp, Strain SopsisLIS2011" /LENGTH=169 /DNA_ID=CAMNT_0004536369 /DNA_START=440 /DNA_END=949 /DNA_ORIENTATION=+
MKKMFMHLTNFSLNKDSANYKAPDDEFLNDGGDSGSKRLLSSLWKLFEEEGLDIDLMKEKIDDTVRKAIISIEPFLIHSYHQKVAWEHESAKCFQLIGVDILIDRKCNAWLMEINANPSLNMFLERELENGEVEKQLSELDKFVKTKVVAEAIRIVTDNGTNEFEGTFN